MVTQTQPLLLPDADDELLLARCTRYRALAPALQQLVRGYVQVLRQGGRVTKSRWIDASGLPSSSAYDLLKRDATTIWPAITEAAQLFGEGGLLLGGLALCLAGEQLYEQLAERKRDTRSLTPTELAIMRDCAQGAGLLAFGTGTQTARLHMRDDRGREIDLSVSSTPIPERDHLDALLCQEGAAAEGEAAAPSEAAESLRSLTEAAAEPAGTAVGEGPAPGQEGAA